MRTGPVSRRSSNVSGGHGEELFTAAGSALPVMPTAGAAPKKTRGPAVPRRALEFVGRPCRDRTYDQRIKSLSHPRNAPAKVQETKGVLRTSSAARLLTEPMPNPNGGGCGRGPSTSNGVNDLLQPLPNPSRTRSIRCSPPNAQTIPRAAAST